MPDNEYEEWQSAVEEYFSIKEDGFDPYHVFTNLSAEEYEKYKALVEKFDRVIIALGFALTSPKRFSSAAEYFRYLFIQRSLSSLRTIREMYNKRYNGDCLSITRTLYEAYLRMKLLRLDPTSAARFEAALAYQVGMYKPKLKKNGKPNFDIVVDPETGKEFLIAVSNREIIEISDFALEQQFYHDLYPLLSGFVHPDLLHVAAKSIGTSASEISQSDDPIHASIFVATVCVLLLLEIGESSFLRKITKRDIRYVLKSISKNLLELIVCDSIVKRGAAPPCIYQLFDLEIQTVPDSEPAQ